jgi:hypothetical protein
MTPRTTFSAFLTLLVSCLSFDAASQQSQHSMGLIPLPRDQYENLPLAVLPPAGSLPNQVDLSTLFPTPGNQGRQGSCVAWAVGYALKTYQENQNRRLNNQPSYKCVQPCMDL